MARRRKRRASIRLYLGVNDRLRVDRWAAARGLGPATLLRAIIVDALDAVSEPAVPSWKELLACPTGTRTRRHYSPHLRVETFLRLAGTITAAKLVKSYGGSRLPSPRTVGQRLRRAAILKHWQSERWHSRTFLRRLASQYDLTPERVRRILGPKYLSRRTATYWKRRGELAEREAAAGKLHKPTARLSVRRLP